MEDDKHSHRKISIKSELDNRLHEW